MTLRLIDAWIGRNAVVDTRAREAVAALRPAWVIVGGSEGIGFAIAAALVRQGRDVLIVGRASETLANASRRLGTERPHGSAIAHLALDIVAPGAAEAIDEAAAAAGLYVDTLVLSAAMGLGGAFAEHDPADVDRLVATNVAALTRLVRHALPGHLARGRGGILVLASLGGYVPGPYQAAYYASKAFAIALIEALAGESRGRGVRLSVVVPGPVETLFHARMGADRALYRRLLPSMAPAAVAASALRGHRLGHTVIAPGLIGWPLILVLRILPHSLLVPILGWLLKPR